MDTIYVATAFDANYAQHAGVMLCSLFENHPNTKFCVYLLHREIEPAMLDTLRQLIGSYQQTARLCNVTLADTDTFVVSGHITLAAYLRVFIPMYVDASVAKILYLDADIIINDRIESLWQTDIEEHAVGAVENVVPGIRTVLKDGDDYFNDGVMLINLEQWRSARIMEQTLAFISENPDKIVYHDQDALNAVLSGKWLSLHPKYNMQGALFMDEFDHFQGNPQQLREAIDHPVIIHYSTPLKPWHYLSFHPYTQKYYEYLARTPWRDYQPTDKSALRVVKKSVRPYLRKMGIKKLFGKHLY